MASSCSQPWELNDQEEQNARWQVDDFKETDGLLTEKGCERYQSFDYSLGAKHYMVNLNRHFGSKLLWLLFAAQFLLKGFARDFSGRAEPYLYRLYHVPASQMQIYQGVCQLPWAMKPIIGLASDLCPIRGYNKAPYMFITSVIGAASFMVIGLSSTSTLAISLLVFFLILVQLQCSTADLLSEAKYAERMRQIPSQGPALLSYVWFGMQIGTLLAVVSAGVVLARLGAHKVYLLAAFPAAAILIPLSLNFMEEQPVSDAKVQDARKRFMEQGEAVVLCFLMLAATVTLTILGLSHSQGIYMTALISVIIAVIILVAFSLLLSPTIAKVNAFSLIQTSMSVSVSGAAFYFYTDTLEQYPEGPHFTPFFYNSVVGIVTSIVSLFGIYSYQRWMSTWRYRNILLATNLAYSIICLPDIVLFTRFNLQLGIPDHAFVLGSSVAQSVIFQWQWMPQVVILANLCPPGMEATMYALLAGCHNLGNTIASNCGAAILDSLGVTPSGLPAESSKFENLWKASAISSLLPLLTIVSLFWLMPNAKQTDKLIDEEIASATSGSLWRKWTGRDGADDVA